MTPALAAVAELDDVELMLRVQADDADAFEALFDRFGTRAYSVAYAIARERTRAEDIVQESFLAIWRSRERYEPQEGALGAWVIGIVRHRAIDSVRRNVRHDKRRAGEEQIDGQLQDGPSIEQTTVEVDEAARLRAALAKLPDAQREVIVLAYFGELATTEIASELSLPLGTIKGRMRLGLHKLRTPADLARAPGEAPL